jgi:guanine deaminase
MDKELIPWLNTYTFPEEAKFKNIEYAKIVYEKFISDLINKGTTSSVIYATIHKESTLLLMDLLNESKLRAYVGKVNMDRNTTEDLCEETDRSLRDTEDIILATMGKNVKPIITPRFVPSCTPELMRGLADLANKYDIPVQSHLSENTNEVEWVKKLHPEIKNYASVYDEFGLFGQTKTIMAHCIYTTDEEIKLMSERGVFAAHCALSNYNLSSGIMPVRKYLDYGVKVGIGSDISGGNTLSIPQSIVSTIKASKI